MTGRPSARTHAAVVRLGLLHGMAQPIMLIGGLETSSGMPLDEVWLLDTAAYVDPQFHRKELLFDGSLDVLSVPLPPYMESTNGLGVLWLEMWIKMDVGHGFKKMIVADLNDANGNTAFRLSLSSTAEIYSASLEFYPADSSLFQVSASKNPLTSHHTSGLRGAAGWVISM